jgi:regulator of protease activity HflC (stomatin/prohibitin superfamily)
MTPPKRSDYNSEYSYERAWEKYRKYMEKKSMVKLGMTIGGAVIAGIAALSVIGGSWYTVDQGERGVMLRNGAITGVSEPGLGFKMPIIDRVVDIDVRSRAQVYENVLAYSRDQQVAGLTLSVNYRVPAEEVVSVYENYGGVEQLRSRLLDRQIMDESKNVFGRFNAATAIQDRSRLVAEIQDAVQAAVLGPIIIESVQIENIDFSDAYEQSIEQRMLAEVEVERVRQNAERERVQAEIAVIQAQAAADARVAQATAEAEAIRMQGNAEADAIQARGDALRENPELINLVQAERWNGQLPTTMLPNGTVPFMNMN